MTPKVSPDEALEDLTEEERKSAWRKARLDSLEDDAMQAQIVIEKMSELSTMDTVDTAEKHSILQFISFSFAP